MARNFLGSLLPDFLFRISMKEKVFMVSFSCYPTGLLWQPSFLLIQQRKRELNRVNRRNCQYCSSGFYYPLNLSRSEFAKFRKRQIWLFYINSCWCCLIIDQIRNNIISDIYSLLLTFTSFVVGGGQYYVLLMTVFPLPEIMYLHISTEPASKNNLSSVVYQVTMGTLSYLSVS